jgi:hypothetical protein
MTKGAAGGILATRYFAPKITEVSETPGHSPGSSAGKLVRFKPGPSPPPTPAASSLLFLQNTFGHRDRRPLRSETKRLIFNQVILVRRGSSSRTRSIRSTS